ncbi:hypothetical protein B0H11DRAFT_1937140 [Mycena galericulata]|nr:hypothetical protein B0H11DRAFT_1937140 [Mycena galericulata]
MAVAHNMLCGPADPSVNQAHKVQGCFVAVVGDDEIVWDAPRPIFSSCFQALSQFSNLRELRWSAESLDLPSLPVDALPSLERLHIRYATLVPRTEPSSIKLKLSHFSYTDIPIPRSADAPSYLSFLDPLSLRSLELRAATIPHIHLRRDRIPMSSFHNLHTLELVFEDLRRYTGPCALVPLVLSRSAPKDITISGGFAPDLLLALQGTARDSITSLLLSVKYEDLSGCVLSDVLALFPRVTTVTVHIYLGKQQTEDPGKGKSRTERADALSASLIRALSAPQALKSAALNWWLEDPDPDDIVPDLLQLKATLLSAISSLADVSFGGRWQARR